ncbi:hypothetical protein SAMN04489713_101734 [Actinomadura madurae]|uniref:TfuA-like core domain-containing protein n=1 Tax=Actinomadura madurae TaxID=1993 RepID=A0A1I4X8G7_9ACTN|nr:TfuA-like protein [Actinomadura madurae]SFN21833.1 hypothetical protein SAMN04489713_101734 [Actinomadura madurae]
MRYLFAGPTLPDVRDLVDGNAVRLLPPVAAGDLLGLPLAEGDVVGVIDGYFHQRMAVRHKEIFAALAGGVRVLGASSIGALRAAEMDRYGMEGVGQIYADYRAGLVVGDDEVALLHGPAEAGYPAFSQPLVNIRATLAAAAREAVIEEDEGDRLIGVLAAMPYQRRDYEVLGNLAGELGIERKKGAALVAFCRERAVDLKRRDALLLLDRLNEPPEQVTPRPRLSRTQMLANWELAAGRTSPHDGGTRTGHASSLRVCQLFAQDYPEFHRRLAFTMITDECAGECPEYREDSPGPRAVVAHGRHRRFYTESPHRRDLDFLTRWTTENERSTRTQEELLATFIVRSFRVGAVATPRAAALRALETSPALDRAGAIIEAAAQMEATLQGKNSGYDRSKLMDERILHWFSERWQVEPENAEFAAMDRGFASLDAFLEAAKPFYLLAKYNEDLVDFTVSPYEHDRRVTGSGGGG